MAKTEIQDLRHGDIDPDPNQPRKVFNEQKLIELANDIAVNGILQALSVRPHPTKDGRFMIIFGERRWRGAGLVDLETVPCVVHLDINDAQALEWQMAENGQRDDMHPLEEADGYRVMHERDGREVDEIAELCGKSRAYIYASMKLCALRAEPRRAFLAGRFDKSIALLIARLPENQQAQATKTIIEEGDFGEESMSFREAKAYIRSEFMLRLDTAPFAVNDTTLAPKVGPCTTCPKRTGNQRELFADVVADKHDGGGDVCTDSACFKSKVEVHWTRVAAAAKEKGRQVLEGKAAAGAGSYGDKKLVSLDERAYDAGRSDKTYRQLLGKNAPDAVAAVARTESGQIRELVSRSNLPALLKDAGIKVPRKGPEGTGKSASDYEREQKEQRELERAVTERARTAVLQGWADIDEATRWRLLARLAIQVARNDAQRELCRLLRIDKGDGSYTEALRLKLYELTPQEEQRFVLAALMTEAGEWREESIGDPLGEFAGGIQLGAEAIGLDVDAIVKEVKAELAAAREAKADKKSKKAAPATEAAS